MSKFLPVSTPKYRKPPVVETVIGVQFPEIPGFRASHYGQYWQTIKERYPRTDDQPRLRRVVESFPQKPAGGLSTLEFITSPATQRVWYVAQDDTQLIQVQPDRFLFNWRERESKYPSYAENKKKFLDKFEGFCRFCKNAGLEEPSPDLCEVTYINHIGCKKNESVMDLFSQVFCGLAWETADDWLSTPESAQFNRAFTITDKGKNIGRLYAQASIARHRTDPHEFVQLEITARVNHQDGSSRSIEDSLQIAHDWVVRGFASLTNANIQKERWERSK